MTVDCACFTYIMNTKPSLKIIIKTFNDLFIAYVYFRFHYRSPNSVCLHVFVNLIFMA